MDQQPPPKSIIRTALPLILVVATIAVVQFAPKNDSPDDTPVPGTPTVAAESWSAAAQMILTAAPDSASATIDAVRDQVAAQPGETANVSTARDLLAELGFDSRLIFLYNDGPDAVEEHTVLEVFNPETQQWEVHDVVTNRYFVDENGDRASIERVVFGPLDTVRVCDPDHACTPILDSDTPTAQQFAAFRVGESDTFWVNPDRFDLTRRFPANQNRNLAEYLTGDADDFAFKFGSWPGE